MKKTLEKTTNNEVIEPDTEIIVEKPYSFRKLETKDIFPTFKLLSKIGLKEMKEDESLKNILFLFMGGTANGKIDVDKIGIDIFLEVASLITECIPKAENEFYQLLSQVSDKTAEEIQTQEPAITLNMIIDFVKKEEFADFFKVVLELFK